jgi:transcriptional regulator with XRE-family HTH domain
MAYAPDPILGHVLRERRGDRSQEDVGYHAGVTAATVGRMELAKSKPDWASVRSVADALGISLVELATAIEDAEGKLKRPPARLVDAP